MANENDDLNEPGILDIFAVCALIGILAKEGLTGQPVDDIAARAYTMADAMVAERKRLNAAS